MADVIHLINGTINNGNAVVSANMLGTSYKVSPTVNTNQFSSNSGVLENRLDEDNTNFAVISVNTSSSGVVDAIPGHKINVLNYVLVGDSSCDVSFYSGSNLISGTMSIAANGAISANSDNGLLETNPGEGLLIVASTGNVSGHINYRIE